MGIYQVTHMATFLAQQIRNVFYYTTTVGEPSDSEWQDIADEIRSDWNTEMKTRIVNEYSLDMISRRRVDSAGLLTFVQPFTSGIISGNSAADPLPTQVALLISNKGTTTKPNRARSYLCGFGEPEQTASKWDLATMAACETFIDLQSDLNAGGTNPLQRVSAQWNSGHTMVIASNDLSGAASVASIIPATQRRRRIGVGI